MGSGRVQQSRSGTYQVPGIHDVVVLNFIGGCLMGGQGTILHLQFHNILFGFFTVQGAACALHRQIAATVQAFTTGHLRSRRT